MTDEKTCLQRFEERITFVISDLYDYACPSAVEKKTLRLICDATPDELTARICSHVPYGVQLVLGGQQPDLMELLALSLPRTMRQTRKVLGHIYLLLFHQTKPSNLMCYTLACELSSGRYAATNQ